MVETSEMQSVSPPPCPAAAAGSREPLAGRSVRAIVLFLLVTAAVTAGDLVLKYVAFRTVAGQPVELEPGQLGAAVIPDHRPVEVVPGVLSLQLTLNEGAVFGLGQGGRWVFIGVSVVAVGVIGYFFWVSRAGAWLFHVGLALILGGALGNLYDRVRYAAVRDMLFIFPEVRVWGYPVWPYLFNLADAALVVGVILVVGIMWMNELRQRSGEAARR